MHHVFNYGAAGAPLLKMFTFFRVSFFYVFSPVMFFAIVASLDVVSECFHDFVFFRSIGFGVLGICGVVLVAFKTDSLYDEGTALLFSLPSWVVWVLLYILAWCITPCSYFLFSFLDWCIYWIYSQCSKLCGNG